MATFVLMSVFFVVFAVYAIIEKVLEK